GPGLRESLAGGEARLLYDRRGALERRDSVARSLGVSRVWPARRPPRSGDRGQPGNQRRSRGSILQVARRAVFRAGWRRRASAGPAWQLRSEEHTSELQSLAYLVCRLLLEKKKQLTALVNVPALRLASTVR